MKKIEDSNIEQIKYLISNGNEKAALEILLPLTKGSKYHSNILLLKNKYFSILRKENLGLPFDYREKNEVIFNLITTLEHINENIETDEIPEADKQKLLELIQREENIILWNKRKKILLISGSICSIVGVVFFGTYFVFVIVLLLLIVKIIDEYFEI